MAKIKVHELAKELEIKSKDVITFLQEKGVDVKAAQSSIEGDAVEWVKKKFAAANKEPSDQKDSSRIGQAAQTERKAQVEKAETAEKTTQTAAVQAEGREEQTTDKQDTPMMATLWPFHAGTMGAVWTFSRCQSATKRSRRPMPTGSFLMPRVHLPSHWLSCGQTRPQTAGREEERAMT